MVAGSDEKAVARAPVWQLVFLAIAAELSLYLSLEVNDASIRTALTAGPLLVAFVVVPRVLGVPRLREVASDAIFRSALTDGLLVTAAYSVWKGQTEYEAVAFEYFRQAVPFTTEFALLGMVGGAVWLRSHAYIPDLVARVCQGVSGVTQMLIASLLFPQAPLPEILSRVPLFMLAGAGTQLFWSLHLAPEPTQEPSKDSANKTT